ncbi:MAG: GGDEF domain-containing protein, partial [Lachnospiraceae bacterium]
MAYSSTKKKSSGIVQISICILTVILVVLIIAMMMIVSSIQGTARIVNYAGLVRGKTQRIVKFEISGKQEDDMIQEIESFIDGLRNGNKELNLVRLEDSDFQTKMEELNEYFLMLKQEIMQVRAYGADKTQILSKSERFFEICDEATGLAEVYSQRKASSLSVLEKYITADIVVLMLLIGYEFIKAVRYAAMNRVLQKKVYIDGATGLPNKNKCDELLSQPDAAPEDTGVCSFDLNNLRIINNSMGHEAGDEYIRRFAVCLRASMPAEQFVGRAGGDEFIAVTHGMGKEEMKACLASVREQMTEESKSYPDTPLSYAVGFALASDFPESTMQELFKYADKNMYINKNHVKREEAAAKRQLDYKLLKLLNMHGKTFTDCLYCDVKLDTYRTIRANNNFFLASDGSYSSAAEQIVKEKIGKQDKDRFGKCLKISYLCEKMRTKEDVMELKYDVNEQDSYSRLTFIPVDWDKNGMLHHFLLAFETIRQCARSHADAKEQLTIYYEQLKQSILENDSYVDALLEPADAIYTVNLTNDILERIILLGKRKKESLNMLFDYPLPGSYRDYCSEYKRIVTQETLGSYRMADDCEKLLKRFDAGEKCLSVEFCVYGENDIVYWVQKTILMTQTVVFDEETRNEIYV